MSAPSIDSSLAKIKEYLDSDGEEGAERVSIWTPRVSIAAETNSRGTNITVKVRADDPHEAVRVFDWLQAEMNRRYPRSQGGGTP